MTNLVQDFYKVNDYYSQAIKEKIWADRDKDPYIEHGLISGSKLADASLNIVLKMLGVDQDFDVFTLGKFKRGHTTEAELIEFLTGIPRADQKPNVWLEPVDTRVIPNPIMLQAEPVKGYRGMTNSVDILEDVGNGYILHEIKSATKSAYDYVGAVGKGMYLYKYNYQKKKRERIGKRTPEPKEHNAIQLSSYCLSQWEKPVLKAILHYINADDYRMVSFEIDFMKFKPEIDREIDEVQFAFETKILPEFKPVYDWQKGKYNSFADWESLSSEQSLNKLKEEYPEAYTKFMNTRITDNGKE